MSSSSLTASAVKTHLRHEYNLNHAVSLLEAIDTTSLSVASTRHALSLAAHRLSRSRCFADADVLIFSHLDLFKRQAGIQAEPFRPHLPPPPPPAASLHLFPHLIVALSRSPQPLLTLRLLLY